MSPGLRLGLAGLQQGLRKAADRRVPQPGPPGGHHRPRAPVRDRRVGARLLPPVQEREARLRQGDLRGR